MNEERIEWLNDNLYLTNMDEYEREEFISELMGDS